MDQFSQDNEDIVEVSGHDDKYSSEYDTSSDEEVTRLQMVIEKLESVQKHLEWHCSVYRKALMEIPNGEMVLQKTLNECLYSSNPLCPQCEKEDILLKVADMQAKLEDMERKMRSTSPILGTGSRKKQHCQCEDPK